MKPAKQARRRLPRFPRLNPIYISKLPFPFFRLQRVNLPNQLTLLRMILVVPFIIFFISDDYRMEWIGLGIFFISALTDYFDGKIARQRNLVTNFGKIMDPLADKLLLLTVMILLVQVGVVPGWMVAVIWWRELAVTGLRTLVAAHRGVLAADSWGKLKTLLQIFASVAGMLSFIIQNTLNTVSAGWHWRLENSAWGGDPIAQLVDTYAFAYWLMFLATAVSLFSGIRYFRDNWGIVCEELEEAEHVDK